jgi:hypothetical protein
MAGRLDENQLNNDTFQSANTLESREFSTLQYFRNLRMQKTSAFSNNNATQVDLGHRNGLQQGEQRWTQEPHKNMNNFGDMKCDPRRSISLMDSTYGTSFAIWVRNSKNAHAATVFLADTVKTLQPPLSDIIHVMEYVCGNWSDQQLAMLIRALFPAAEPDTLATVLERLPNIRQTELIPQLLLAIPNPDSRDALLTSVTRSWPFSSIMTLIYTLDREHPGLVGIRWKHLCVRNWASTSANRLDTTSPMLQTSMTPQLKSVTIQETSPMNSSSLAMNSNLDTTVNNNNIESTTCLPQATGSHQQQTNSHRKLSVIDLST